MSKACVQGSRERTYAYRLIGGNQSIDLTLQGCGNCAALGVVRLKEADDFSCWQVANLVDTGYGSDRRQVAILVELGLRPKVAGENPKMETVMDSVVNSTVWADREWHDSRHRE